MILPTQNSLLKKVDSKYTLVVEVAKRARQLVAGEKPLIGEEEDNEAANPVSIAVKEVDADLIHYQHEKKQA